MKPLRPVEPVRPSGRADVIFELRQFGWPEEHLWIAGFLLTPANCCHPQSTTSPERESVPPEHTRVIELWNAHRHFTDQADCLLFFLDRLLGGGGPLDPRYFTPSETIDFVRACRVRSIDLRGSLRRGRVKPNNPGALARMLEHDDAL